MKLDERTLGHPVVFLLAVKEINEMLKKTLLTYNNFFCLPKRSGNKYEVEG